MRKPFYSVVSNSGASDAGRINIYGIIGPDYWNDGTEAKRFIRDLTILESAYDKIDIHINSPGGSIWDGLPIFNAIRASNKEIHTYVDGIAFSMGGIIALAGHTVHAAKGSLLMLHNASGSASGNSKKMRSAATMLDKHDDVLCQLISDKTGKTIDEVKALWMNMDDNFITAQEALEFKLVDIVETYEASEMPENIINMSVAQVAAFYNEQAEEPTQTLLEKIYSKVQAKFVTNNNSNMDFQKIKVLAGDTPPTQEQLDAANAVLTTEGITQFSFVAESVITAAADVTAENTTLKTQVTNLTAQKDKAETDLSTANTTIETLNAKIATMPGATHITKTGEDPVIEDNVEDLDAIMANLPHNKNADRVLVS